MSAVAEKTRIRCKRSTDDRETYVHVDDLIFVLTEQKVESMKGCNDGGVLLLDHIIGELKRIRGF